MNLSFIFLFSTFLLGIEQQAFANRPLNICALQLQSRAKDHKTLSAELTDHFGGFETAGGLTTIDTSDSITSAVTRELLVEYRKLRPRDPTKTQQSYEVKPTSRDRNPVADFIRKHAVIGRGIVNHGGKKWKWDTSSLMLLSERIQTYFHNHLNPRINGKEAWVVVSLNGDGTVFQSPDRTETYSSKEGETSAFNDLTLHMSPEDPPGGTKDRLFLLHFFSEI